MLSANPVGMIVVGVPDIGLTPGGRAAFTTPIEFARAAAAADEVNGLLGSAVLARGQVFVDLSQAMRDINLAPLVVGGVTIDTVNASSDPTHFFQDGRHPAAVGNGTVANLFLTAANVGFGASHALLTDQEILATAGMSGSYTGQTSNLPYARYVILPVPEPASLVLLLSAAGVFAVSAVLRRRAHQLPEVPARRCQQGNP